MFYIFLWSPIDYICVIQEIPNICYLKKGDIHLQSQNIFWAVILICELVKCEEQISQLTEAAVECQAFNENNRLQNVNIYVFRLKYGHFLPRNN